MADISFTIDFGYISGGIYVGKKDVTDSIAEKFEITRPYHGTNYLESQIMGKFTILKDSAEMIGWLLSSNSDYLPIEIDLDTSPFFKGYVRNNFNGGLSKYLDKVSMEVLGFGQVLKKRILETKSFESKYILDMSDSTSIVLSLLKDAGFTFVSEGGDPADFYTIDISGLTNIKTIDVPYHIIPHGDNKNYWEAIQEILKECGYVLAFNLNGNPFLASTIVRGSPSYTEVKLSDFVIKKKFSFKRSNVSFNMVTANYYTHSLLENRVIYKDTTDADTTYECIIPIEYGEYYPPEAGDPNTTAWINFENEIDGKELVAAIFNTETITWEWDGHGFFTVVDGLIADNWEATRAKLSVQNTDDIHEKLRKITKLFLIESIQII
jgi:hypothetical protein